MDDILEVVDFEKAILKVDIEGTEVFAMQHASLLLSKIFVPFIFMEFVFYLNERDKAETLIATMKVPRL